MFERAVRPHQDGAGKGTWRRRCRGYPRAFVTLSPQRYCVVLEQGGLREGQGSTLPSKAGSSIAASSTRAVTK